MVEADETGVFFLSRRVARGRRYFASGGQREQEVWLRVLHAVFSDHIRDTRDIVIISLANACDVFRQMLLPDEYAEVRQRIELTSRRFQISPDSGLCSLRDRSSKVVEASLDRFADA